jgi:hypothetical protein
MTTQRSKRRPVTFGDQELHEMAGCWAREMFAAPAGKPAGGSDWPGRQTRAVIVQTEDRDDDHSAKGVKRRQSRSAAVRRSIAEAEALVKAGDHTAARSLLAALADEDLPPVYWCDTVEALARVLAECLRNGEQCYDSGPIDGPDGRVVAMSVWYDPSHPVGPS